MGKHGLDGGRRNIVGKVGEEIILNVGGGGKKKSERKRRRKIEMAMKKPKRGRIGNIFFFCEITVRSSVGGERNKEIILFFWRAAP